MPQVTKKPLYLYTATFVASLIISLWTYLNGDIINSDGLLYIRIADNFNEGGIASAFSAFKWPFYGILIGVTHQLTQLSLENAAHLVNSLLLGLACTTFVAIYKELGHQDTRPWVAAILILSLPLLNDYRGFVIRDYGYWTFTLISLLYFIKFTKNPSLTKSLAWQTAVLITIVFRIEGIAFLAVPVIYFIGRKGPIGFRLITVLQSSFLFLLAALIGAFFAVHLGTISADQGLFALWLSYLSPTSIFNGVHAEAIELRNQLEFLPSDGEAALVLVSGLASLAVVKVGTNSVLPYLLIAGYGHKNRWLQTNPTTRPVFLFLTLALLTVSAILMSQFFLSSRYTVLAVLLVSLVTFPYVDRAFQMLGQLKSRHWSVIAWVFVLALFLDGVISGGASKAPIKTGALWALENIDQSRSWVCNEHRIQFYSDEACEFIGRDHLLSVLNKGPEIEKYGHLLLWVGRKDHTLAQSVEQNDSLHLVKRHENSKGDRLMIYATTPIAPHRTVK